MAGEPNRYFLGNKEFALTDKNATEPLIQRLRQYLDLRHVNLLVGNGASLPLGSPSIRSIRKTIPEFNAEPYALTDETSQKLAQTTILQLLGEATNDLPIEPLLGTIAHLLADLDTLPKGTTIAINKKSISADQLRACESQIKKWLFLRCWKASFEPPDADLAHHRELLRRFLLRPPSMPRLKVFTTNYDCLIERSLDSLGVSYFDGFVGTICRTLRSESYNYDLYFPGHTTEGQVRRVDRVVHLYKLHGSLTWRRHGEGHHLDVAMDHRPIGDDEYGDVMIYPSPVKLTEIHGYPYSEMLRHFAASIQQPQTVLFTLGYSFADDHINRLIYQALTIPSFVLVIVLPSFAIPSGGSATEPEHEVWRLIHHVQSKRVLVITGGQSSTGTGGFDSGAGTLQEFATQWMPDISEMAIDSKVREEVARVLGNGHN